MTIKETNKRSIDTHNNSLSDRKKTRVKACNIPHQLIIPSKHLCQKRSIFYKKKNLSRAKLLDYMSKKAVTPLQKQADRESSKYQDNYRSRYGHSGLDERYAIFTLYNSSIFKITS